MRIPNRAGALALLATSACSGADADQAPPSTITALPAAVLLHYDVWAGTDAPWLVVYADGTVLSPRERDEEGWPLSYEVSRVPAKDAAMALSRFGIGDDFMRLDSAYDLNPQWSDQPTVIIHTWDGTRHRQVAVRGGLQSRGRLDGRVPAAFRVAFDRMIKFRGQNARTWSPDTVSVSVWPYEYAPDNPPLPWPAGWPDLNTPGTIREPNPHVSEVYTIPLAAAHAPELARLLRRLREKQAVEINGRKWAVAYRLLVPGESAWRSEPPALEP